MPALKRPWQERAVAPRVGTGRTASTAGAVRQPEVGRGQGGALVPWPSGRRNEGSRRSYWAPAPTWGMAADSWRWRRDALGIAGGDGSLAVVAAVALEPGFRSCASRPERATTSRSTSASIDTISVGALDAFTDAGRAPDRFAEVNGRLSSTTSRSGSTATRYSDPDTATRSYERMLDTAARRSRPERGAPRLRVVDDLGREHRDPAVVLVPTTPTRSSGRS